MTVLYTFHVNTNHYTIIKYNINLRLTTRKGLIPLGLYHWAYTTGLTPLGLHHWAYTTGLTPLGLHHWAYTTGLTPLGSHHWAYTTGLIPLGLHQWAYTTGLIPLGLNHWAYTTAPAEHNFTGRKEMFYLTTHSTYFIYGYIASDI